MGIYVLVVFCFSYENFLIYLNCSTVTLCRKKIFTTFLLFFLAEVSKALLVPPIRTVVFRATNICRSSKVGATRNVLHEQA